ncbi:hypothetical protein [Flavobacterium album]|uniref:hypothetical protein n=1 Tax=Flavobacterium album TaxID=2175091 RepID=UPI0011B21DCD|nr:hypothetical protein [Flavobacterium album]
MMINVSVRDSTCLPAGRAASCCGTKQIQQWPDAVACGSGTPKNSCQSQSQFSVWNADNADWADDRGFSNRYES